MKIFINICQMICGLGLLLQMPTSTVLNLLCIIGGAFLIITAIFDLMNIEKKCQHEFRLCDMKLTGIPELAKPTSNDVHEWEKYFREIYTHDSLLKRVACPCNKCGKMFYAADGLSIISKGKVVQDGIKSE